MSLLTAPDQSSAPAIPVPTAGSPYGAPDGMGAKLSHIGTLAARTLRKMQRTPEQLIDATLQPILFVVLFVYLFGGAVSGSRHEYLQFVLPSLLAQTIVFASLTIGVNMKRRQQGCLRPVP